MGPEAFRQNIIYKVLAQEGCNFGLSELVAMLVLVALLVSENNSKRLAHIIRPSD